MLRFLRNREDINRRLEEKDRGLWGVYAASKEDLDKYLSAGCASPGCGGDIELLRDEKIPRLIEGYRCRKCGTTTLYTGYTLLLEG